MSSITGRMPFVGREQELDELCAQLEESRRGHGAVVLLSGEPGIGKTRLAEEFAAHAAASGCRVAWGRCYEGEGAPAFWPWVQILRALLPGSPLDPRRSTAANTDTSAASPPSIAAGVAPLLPELGGRAPDTHALSLDTAQARFRLFDAVTTFLLGQVGGEGGAVLLILDDLHWADTPSLLLLRFLARELSNARLLVVATYRDTEVDRGHPLTETLALLARERACRRLVLSGLAKAAISQVIADLSGFTPAAELVAALHDETEGNPFFATEVVRLMAADGRLQAGIAAPYALVLPPSVHEAIGLRLNRLTAGSVRVLTIAAVMGREFTLAALGQVGEIAGEPLLEVLEEAETSRVITAVPDTSDRFRFAHALIREVLYEELPATRRARLHRQVGIALEACYARDVESHLAELAHHFLQAAAAGEGERAVTYARRAGNRAMALLAYEEAASYYGHGLEVMSRDPHADRTHYCELLLARGDALSRSGDVAAARTTYEQAATAARQADAPHLLARAALGYGGAAPEMGLVNERLLKLIDDALVAVGEQDSAPRARLLARQAMELYHAGAREERTQLSAAALAMARRLHDPATLAFALNARYQALWEPENAEERLAVCAELLQTAERAADPEMALMGHALRVPALLEFGDLDATREEVATHARLAVASRQPFHLWHAERLLALQAYLDGRFDDMERHAHQALAVAERGQIGGADVLFVSHLQFLRRDQGRMPELEAPIKDIMARYPRLAAGWGCPLVNVYAAAGRRAEAQRELDTVRDGNVIAAFNPPLAALGVFALLTDGIAILGDRRAAALVAERLRPYARRFLVNGATPNFYGCCAHYLGVLAGVLGRWDEAVDQLETALEMNAHTGVPSLLARTRAELAAALVARGRAEDRSRAAALVDDALADALALGMRGLAVRMEALQRERGQTNRAAYPAGLTAREAEVLRLLASGMSNKEIAAALVVTLNTVEHHLVSIYGKIGARGRAAATAYAFQHQLA